jgi:exodeoxyribonuclease VII small subunit
MTTTVTFEEQVGQLEQLVARLERGELPLAESLAAFQRGMQLVQACEKQLELAEMDVQRVLGSPSPNSTIAGCK